MEECSFDDAGQLTSGSFIDYAMPRAADVPFFETVLSEVP
jgi:carbon-monoxide dehydrogenase large subunit